MEGIHHELGCSVWLGAGPLLPGKTVSQVPARGIGPHPVCPKSDFYKFQCCCTSVARRKLYALPIDYGLRLYMHTPPYVAAWDACRPIVDFCYARHPLEPPNPANICANIHTIFYLQIYHTSLAQRVHTPQIPPPLSSLTPIPTKLSTSAFESAMQYIYSTHPPITTQ